MAELNELFKRWLDRDKEQAGFNDEKLFTRDGIIDEKRWNNVPENKRVLFILKEPSEPLQKSTDDTIKTLCDVIRDIWKGVKYPTFCPLGAWAYGLINADKASVPPFEEANKKENKDEAFLSSAIMNLKKYPAKKCNYKKLRKYAEMHEDHIKDEIKIIDPEIIVWCGTFDVLDSKTLSNGKKFIKMCHPQASKWNPIKGTSISYGEEKYNYLLENILT